MAMAADDGSGIQNGSEGFGQELAALTMRVAQLERQLAELSEAPQRQTEFSHAFTPIQRGVPPQPPPPMPAQAADLPMMPLVIPERPPLSTPQHQPLPSARSLESRLGSQGFNMIGIVAILAGASYFLKLAIERGWLTHAAQVIIGLLAGAGVVLWSENFRRKGYKAFSYSLKAVGSSVLYLSLWASFHLYNQLPANVVPVSQYFTDVQNGTLPQVALIEGGYNSGRDEHPNNNVQTGAAYASTLINGLMDSPSWKDSVFILTYDEAGGLYDHVAPQPAVSPDGIAPIDLNPGDTCTGNGGANCDFNYTGFRLPLIVVSPFTKKNFVSHTVADFTAILKLIETRVNVPALTQRDAAQMDMTEFFDFVNVPWATPPTPPTQAVNGVCDFQKLQ